jgi:methyl-accepting chemotaxis protein
VSEAATRAEEIFHGADGHTNDVDKMVSSMDEIARVAERNAGAIDAVVASTQRQVTLMTEMVASSKSMTDLAESQRGALHRFQTGGPDTKKTGSEVAK